MTDNREMTLAEASAYLGVTHGFLRQCCIAGRLSARKLGHIWVVTQSEIERYASEQLGKMGPKGK